MSFPTPKEEPQLYALAATAIVGALAKYGIHWDESQVLLVLGFVGTALSWLARRHTVAMHPSSGLTVKPVAGKQVQVAEPKKP